MKEYTIGLYEKAVPGNLSWEEKLSEAKEAGYDFLEISIDETEEKLNRLNMSSSERLELIRIMSETGLPIRTMCLSGHRKYSLGSMKKEVSQRGLEIMEKAIQFADDIGIRIIQIAGYDVYYEESDLETKKLFLANLRKAVSMAESAGVILGFEPMDNNFMNTIGKAMKYITLVNSSYLKIYPDIGNITNAANTYKTDVLEDLYIGRGHMVAMHLKETIPGKYREVPYGEGNVNFKEAIRTAWQMGIRKYVTEFWYTGNLKWKDELCAVNKMFKGILQEQINFTSADK